jgi:hypothetical protein
MGKIINAYISFIRKPERERALGRCRYRMENNIIKDYKEMGIEDMNWIHLRTGFGGRLL